MTAIDPQGLRPHPLNPRMGDVAAIARSLQVNGQYRPVVVDAPSRTVLAGWHTVSAARALGWETVEAVLVDVDEEAAARIVLADNRTADLGGYNTDALVAMLVGLDLDGTGYEPADLDDLLGGIGVYDPADPTKAEARDEPGETAEGVRMVAVAVGKVRFVVEEGTIQGWLSTLGGDPAAAILTRLGISATGV